MCSADGCDTAAEARGRLRTGCRVEPDFASLSLSTGRGSGEDGSRDSTCTHPCAAIPKATTCVKHPSLPERKIKSQSPADAEQSTAVLMARVKGRDSFVPQRSGDVAVGHGEAASWSTRTA